MSKRMIGLALLAVVFAGAAYARSVLEIDWKLESIRELVAGLGIWGPVTMVLLIAFRSPLLLPSQAVLLVAGLCFGTAAGTLYGALGLWLSGMMAFGLTRWLGGEALRDRVPGNMRRTLDLAGSRGGAGLLALATAYPIGALTLYHAAAALTRMWLPHFVVALALGSAGRAFTYAYFGSTLFEQRWTQLAIGAALFGAAFLPLLHPGVRAWIRRQFELGPEEQPQEGGPGGR